MFTALIPTHQVGAWLVSHIDAFLDKIGLKNDQTIEAFIYICVIVALAIIIGWAVRKVILFIAEKAMKLHPTDIGNELLQQNIFTKASHIIPPLVFLALIPFAFETDNHTLALIEKFVLIYFLIMLGIGLNSILTFMWVHFDSHENTNKHPLRGLLNTGHGIVWILIVISILSIIIGKSPGAILTGIGVFATALMLIFKDSILGLVAGIQLSQNDMLRVGDWIVVTNTPANGTVIEVTLTTVKVRNWDNTIIMVPPYTLVSTSFQNWRGMTESGARQIARYYYFDNESIKAIDDATVDSLVAKFPILKTFVDDARRRKAAGQGPQYNSNISPVNGTIDTNMGLFRAYLGLYMTADDAISKDQYMLVRLQQPTEFGTPLQLFVFTPHNQWPAYEAVQSALFEHIAVVAPEFGLKIYNAPDHNRFEVEMSQEDALPVPGKPVPGIQATPTQATPDAK
ncbi:MAG: mechanosensitive ion channel family protein [Muribaculaceae bacterium]|nr:mechanosensitive ion channel family protein [Muribaculaceae bacterium]